MKTKKLITIILACLCAAMLLVGVCAACGSKQSMEPTAPGMNEASDFRYSSMPETARDSYSNVAYDNAVGATNKTALPPADGGSGAEQKDRFIISTWDASIQTKTYDAFSAALNAKLKELNGYIDSFSEYNYDADRQAQIVARVPQENLDKFMVSLKENGTIMNQNKNNSDVTDEMIDTGSRKDALKAEETALIAILEKAKTVNDIITVQDRLSNVRAELQSYSQKLQQLTNQVKYSTVNISVSEVNRIVTPTQKFSKLAGSGFVNSLKSIGRGFRDFTVWFITVFPYLVLIAIPVTVFVIVYLRKRKEKKKAAKT